MAYGKNFRAYLVGAFSATGGFLFGYHTGVISGVLTMKDFKNMTNIKDNYSNGSAGGDTTNAIIGLIVGVLLFGCFIGSLIGGQMSDRFSRKYSISIFSFIFTISAGLQIIRGGLALVLIARFIAGLSIGALSMIVPMYHSEIAATKVRGRIITLQQWAITIGIAISFWINFATYSTLEDTESEWRIPLGLQIIPSSILTIGILFCPFSPRWLISHDREDEARDVLMKIRSASHDEIEEEMQRIRNEVAYLRENEIESYRQLFRSPLRRPFILGVGIQILQQLTGINATMYYAPKIFEMVLNNRSNVSHTMNAADNSLAVPLLATGVNGCVNVIATIPTLIFIDKLGRRRLLIAGAIIMSISMLIVAILIPSYGYKMLDIETNTYTYIIDDKSISWTIIIFIYIFVGGFAFSWGPIAWIYCTEIFPLTMRAKATSLTTAANWVTNCAISFLVPLLLARISYITFIIFSMFCAAMIGIVYFFYPETKNIHLERNNMSERKPLFVPQWLEDRRIQYNTFPQQPSINETHVPFTNEQNPIIQRDDYLQEKNLDSNEDVS